MSKSESSRTESLTKYLLHVVPLLSVVVRRKLPPFRAYAMGGASPKLHSSTSMRKSALQEELKKN